MTTSMSGRARRAPTGRQNSISFHADFYQNRTSFTSHCASQILPASLTFSITMRSAHADLQTLFCFISSAERRFIDSGVDGRDASGSTSSSAPLRSAAVGLPALAGLGRGVRGHTS